MKVSALMHKCAAVMKHSRLAYKCLKITTLQKKFKWKLKMTSVRVNKTNWILSRATIILCHGTDKWRKCDDQALSKSLGGKVANFRFMCADSINLTWPWTQVTKLQARSCHSCMMSQTRQRSVFLEDCGAQTVHTPSHKWPALESPLAQFNSIPFHSKCLIGMIVHSAILPTKAYR